MYQFDICWKKYVGFYTFFASCEIMHLTNGVIDFKNKFWLLQAPAILKDSAPTDIQNDTQTDIHGMFFLGEDSFREDGFTTDTSFNIHVFSKETI